MIKTKPSIAIIGLKGLPAYGGAAAVGQNIIAKLHHKYEFTVYSIASHTELQTGIFDNICHQIVFKRFPINKLNSLVYYIKSTIHALFCSYDLIHLHHRDASFILPFLRLKYKVVMTTHGMVLTDKWKKFKILFNFQDRLFLKFASLITTVSIKDHEIVKNILKSSSHNIIYIPNGININQKKFEKKNYLSFAAGRIIPNKGAHLLLEAVKINQIEEKILLIGDLGQMSEYGKNITLIASQLKNVELIPLIKNKDELFEIIGSSKIFIYPSLIESMSMMMLEVVSLGTPMICSRIKENMDIFSDNEVLYFEPGNSDDLANKIVWAINNLDQMLIMAERAHAKLISNYLWDDIAVKYSETFDSQLSQLMLAN